MSYNCCGKGHEPHPVNHCDDVINNVHYLFAEAEELYAKSDEVIDKQVLFSIMNSIKALEKAFELGGKGVELEECAIKILDKSGCSNTCNKNSIKCEALAAEAEEKFLIETNYLEHALILLKDALGDVKKSIVARKEGYALNHKYKGCIHD